MDSDELLEAMDWTSLGDLKISKTQVYDDMSWMGIELEGKIICGAPFGGPIAVVRDPTKMSFADGDEDVTIYSASGRELGVAELDGSLRLFKIGWTLSEHLYVVYSNGQIDAYDVNGELSDDRCFVILNGSTHEELVDVVILGESLAALSYYNDKYYVYIVSSLTARRIETIDTSRLGFKSSPTCLGLLDPRHRGGTAEVILGTQDNNLIVASSERSYVVTRVKSALTSVVRAITVSPSGNLIALFGEDAVVTIFHSNLNSDPIMTMATDEVAAPDQFAWMGEQCVALSWSFGRLLLLSLDGDKEEFDFNSTISVVSEIDSLRVIEESTHSILQVVSDAVINLEDIGSCEPAAILQRAHIQYNQGSAACHEDFHMLVDEGTLSVAIHDCIEAALLAFPQETQKKRLMAARDGRRIDPQCAQAAFVNACRSLRVLNTLRDFAVGLPLTNAQKDALGYPAIIHRLLSRRQYRVADDLCSYLNLPDEANRVLIHWACAKVRSESLSDDETIAILKRKLEGLRGVPYTEISRAAEAAGHGALAAKLLTFVSNLRDRVISLLRTDRSVALELAHKSADPDLFFFVVHQLQRHFQEVSVSRTGTVKHDPEDAFVQMMQEHPQCLPLLVSPLSPLPPALQRRLLESSASFARAARTAALQAALKPLEEPADDVNIQELTAAVDGLRKARKSSAKDSRAQAAERESAAELAPLLEDALVQAEALAEAAGAAQSLPDAEVSISRGPAAAIATLLYSDAAASSGGSGPASHAGGKIADKLQKEAKVTDAVAWHARVAILARAEKFTQLWQLANEKKSPIGYRPFAEACLRAGNSQEARRYVMEKMSEKDFDSRFEVLISLPGGIGNMDALDLAVKAKSSARLIELRELVVTPSQVAAVKKAFEELGIEEE